MMMAQRPMHWTLLAVLSLGLGAAGLTGCGEAPTEPTANAADHDHNNDHANGPFAEVDTLVAVMRPTEGHDVHGVITFTYTNDEVRMVANVSGLTPDQQHAIHIHEYGDDRSDDGTSTGGHYNPEGHPHGLPNAEDRHAGDLGNLEADADGHATYEIVVENVTLAGHHNPIIGRAVIIHEDRDDGSQPVGDAGGRIASGIIGVANPEID